MKAFLTAKVVCICGCMAAYIPYHETMNFQVVKCINPVCPEYGIEYLAPVIELVRLDAENSKIGQNPPPDAQNAEFENP